MAAIAIAIVTDPRGLDHFAGVDDALAARGVEAARVPCGDRPNELPASTRVVAVADVRSFAVLNVLRQARQLGACSVLLMDGIAEHRNTFGNPRIGPWFLRPAPVDVVACAGRGDEARLRELGNDAVATGLPRLAAIGPLRAPPHPPHPPHRPCVLVATARQPAFNDRQRRQLLDALATLRGRLDALGAEIRWRLTGGLDLDLGVAADDHPLSQSLAAAAAVITTPSTLLVEAMRAERPTALLFPFDGPCWPQAAWMIDGAALSAGAGGSLDGTIEGLLHPGREAMSRQRAILRVMHQQTVPPAEAVAELLIELVDRPRFRRHAPRRLDPTRLPRHLPAHPVRPRVVSLVRWPVGGIATWSARLARAFAECDGACPYDVRTLLVATHPDAVPPRQAKRDALWRHCVVDVTGDPQEAVGTLCRAIMRLEPAVVLPNESDLCYAAAMQLGHHGVRTIAVAHTHHDSCRRLIETYDRWEGAAGVSDACMSWLTPLAAGRPVARIPCAAPVSPRPRRVEAAGPLTLAYVGRMVEVQKRISDLLLLADGLEQLAVRYELHVVGDGEDLEHWRRSLARRRLRHGRVVVHGRRTAQWVQRFLAGIDASILLSEFEGTSVTMLEAMGAGVVPAVTRVDSGVDEWISDGVNGVTVPVGRPDLMAARLAELAADRGRLAEMGRAAWQTVRDSLSYEAIANRYAQLMDVISPGLISAGGRCPVSSGDARPRKSALG